MQRGTVEPQRKECGTSDFTLHMSASCLATKVTSPWFGQQGTKQRWNMAQGTPVTLVLGKVEKRGKVVVNSAVGDPDLRQEVMHR